MPQTESPRAPLRARILFPLLAVCAAAGASHAQAGPTLATVHPLDATASVPKAEYRSALAGYRAFAEEDVRPWSETNQTVARIGGWRAYLREAQQPAHEGGDADAGAHRGHAGHWTK